MLSFYLLHSLVVTMFLPSFRQLIHCGIIANFQNILHAFV